MFEWKECEDDLEFRQALSENPWLKKFLMQYAFDEGFVFFDEERVLSKIGVKKLRKDQSFKQQLLKHIKQKRREMVGTPMHLQSFQYLLYVLTKMRKNVREHYEIITPYLLQLNEKDASAVIDVFQKNLKLSEMQISVLKGGI